MHSTSCGQWLAVKFLLPLIPEMHLQSKIIWFHIPTGSHRALPHIKEATHHQEFFFYAGTCTSFN